MDKIISDLTWFKKSMLHDTSTFKKRLISEEGFEYRCAIESCGLTEWAGRSISLQLDHIDGVRFNNNRSNLRFICPNCHSQTETFCGRNSKRNKITIDWSIDRMKAIAALNPVSRTEWLRLLGISPTSCTRQQLDEKLAEYDIHSDPLKYKFVGDWPSEKVLKLWFEIDRLSVTEVARRVGVSDNAVLKFCKRRNIETPKRGETNARRSKTR